MRSDRADDETGHDEIARWLEDWMDRYAVASADPGEDRPTHDAFTRRDACVEAAKEDGRDLSDLLKVVGTEKQLLMYLDAAIRRDWEAQLCRSSR